MVTSGEVVGGSETTECTDCGEILPLRVLLSGAGYYIGYRCPNCGPYSRESQYYSTQIEAQDALKSGKWIRRW